MSLPATDDFAGTGALSANWAAALSTVTRSAGVAVSSAGNGSVFWNADSFNGDQYSQVLQVAAYCGPGVRMAGTSGYIASVNNGDAAIYRCDSGSFTLLNIPFTGTSVGAVVKLTATGVFLDLLYDGVSQGVGISDGTYTSGAAGFMVFAGSPGQADNWEGGNIGGVVPRFLLVRN